MPRAVLKNGIIYPLEPLPPDWTDGKELQVDEADDESPESIEPWYRELEKLCAASDPEDEERLQAALDEAHQHAKALMRRSMGLAE